MRLGFRQRLQKAADLITVIQYSFSYNDGDMGTASVPYHFWTCERWAGS